MLFVEGPLAKLTSGSPVKNAVRLHCTTLLDVGSYIQTTGDYWLHPSSSPPTGTLTLCFRQVICHVSIVVSTEAPQVLVVGGGHCDVQPLVPVISDIQAKVSGEGSIGSTLLHRDLTPQQTDRQVL